jgi:methyl-accepting chemotaxis protein
MSKGVQGIAASSQEVSERAVQATRISKEGSLTIHNAVTQMSSIQVTVENLSLVIKRLTNQSNEIGNIVSLISEISAQTNLLSLNASIEAARAGEHGRGFAVVAQEVKKLSEQTADSTKQIMSMIKTIQTEAQQAVASMEITFSEVTGGIQVMNRAGELFSQIQLSIEDVEKQIQEVSIASKQVLNGADQAAQAMGTISAIVEVSAAATHNVSSAAEEQLASMEEIAASSEALSKMAIELQEMNEKFKM